MTQGYPNLCNPKCVWVAEGGEGERRESKAAPSKAVALYMLLPLAELSRCHGPEQPRPANHLTNQPASQPACLLPAPVPSTIHHSASSSLRRAKDGAEEREEKSPISVEWFSPHRVPEFPPVCFPEKATGLGDVTLQGESVTLL